MGLISLPYNPQPDDPEDVTEIMANFQAVLAQTNGNLEASSNVLVGTAGSTLLGSTNAEGSATALARADHTHQVQGVELRAADPSSGHFVGRLYFNTTTERLMSCTDAGVPTYAAVVSVDTANTGAIVYNAAGVPTWTSSPADNQLLRAVGTVPTWKTSERVALRRAASQNVVNGGWTALSFDTEDLDTDTMWVIGTPTHMEINTAGDYLAGGGVQFTAGATGRIGVRITKNGNATNLRHMFSFDDATNKPTIAGIVPGLTASDYLEVQVYQTSGTTRATDTSAETQAYGFATRLA